ncbi:MAG: carboxymuconolactone decarboxylase family protein [Propionibacteriales bacterium]|nr:carboxymuconolactone decarboxylase family protein [Propionibacteriales bacterium]
MVEQRGYVLESHKLLAEHDLDALKALNGVATACYLEERLLDDRTKELLFIVSMTALKLPKRAIQNHIKLALDLGITPQEILEAIEILLPEAGVPTLSHGLEAWAEVVGAEPFALEIETYEGGPVEQGRRPWTSG